MKPKFRTNTLLLGAIALCASLNSVQAEYWDTNGTTAGFGTASGTWGTDAFWNTSSSGGAGTFTATPGATAARLFGNGATGLGGGTITVSGTVNSGAMTFASGSGNILISGGTINFGTAATNTYFTVAVNNALTTISSNLVGVVSATTRGLQKTGTGILSLTGDNSGLTGAPPQV